MNIYLVKTKDIRSYKEVILDDGSGPEWDIWPMAPVAAETRGRAKSLFLKKYGFNRLHSGVETDDYPNLRTRLLFKDVNVPEGIYEDTDEYWNKITLILETERGTI